MAQSNDATLLFIDEIQNSPNVVAMLRYFHENKPELHVICAGSLLETLIDNHISFPVGRVEYEYLFPVSKAMLLHLAYPTTMLEPPYESNFKKSPKLQFLDTGLVNYCVGLQKEFIKVEDLNNFYQGRIAEHIVGQQLIRANCFPRNNPLFWVREKAQSNAEVDFVIPNGNELMPVEVKSRKTGSLRSLHSFMDRSIHKTGLRLCANHYNVETAKTLEGDPCELINLPYYLSGNWLRRFIDK